MKNLEKIIDYLKSRGVRFADCREHGVHEIDVSTEDQRVSSFGDGETRGVGIRVLADNGWGYVSSRSSDVETLKKAADKALEIAGFASRQSQSRIEYCDEPVHVDEYSTPIEKDPFTMEPSDIVNPLLHANEVILKQKDIIKANGMVKLRNQKRKYMNTDGSRIQTNLYAALCEVTAFARANGEVKTRSYRPSPVASGFEYFEGLDFESNARRIAEQAREHCFAKNCETGPRTLVLDHENLGLTMHESVGHPTELDRVLGYEESCAGRSFATMEKLGNFKYGSDIVNFVADNTMDKGLATYGYDDEGVKCGTWHMVKDGVLSGYGVNRELAHKMGLERANGTTRATRYHDVPIVRIPNLYLAPGTEEKTPEDLIAETEDGIYIEGRGSFSIDQMRLNMQFGGDAFWEIKNGKIAGMLKNVIYNAISYEFWRSCEAIADNRFFRTHGFVNCGKGDPMQLAQMTHGASPARFRNIMVRGGKMNQDMKNILAKNLENPVTDHQVFWFYNLESQSIRFSNNEINRENMSLSDYHVNAEVGVDRRTSDSYTNRITPEGIEAIVEKAGKVARLLPEDPEYMPPVTAEEASKVKSCNPVSRMPDNGELYGMLEKVLEGIRKKGLTAAGLLSSDLFDIGVMNNMGADVGCQKYKWKLNMTAMTEDSSFKTIYQGKDLKNFDIDRFVNTLVEKTEMTRSPQDLDPGNYTVLLSPLAVTELLLMFLFYNFNAKAIDEKRSAFSERLDQKIADESVHIFSDPHSDSAPGMPFWYEDGFPTLKYDIIRDGKFRTPQYTRYYAAKKNVACNGRIPMNISIKGTHTSEEDLMAGIDNGVYVNSFWYIRVVDQMDGIFTGMTRDGFFRIKNGKIAGSLKNMRFNQSGLDMLMNVCAIGREKNVPAHSDFFGFSIPPLVVKDFNFTSGTHF